MTQQDFQRLFDANQADPMCPDTWVQWAGDYAVLYEIVGKGVATDRELTVLDVRLKKPLIDRIVRWCAKNGYRCSKIQNGKIIL